jgi:hypothetical protein
MSTVQKLGMGIIGVALVATLVLPGRQTPAVLNAFGQFTTGTLSTAMGTSQGAVN